MKKHKYDLKIYNGRVKVYVDGYVMFSFNQIDFKGYYSYQDYADLYNIDIYLITETGGSLTMKISLTRKENWLNILKLLDTHL